MDELYGIIYKVTNTISEKIYVGQTVQTLHSRRIKHESNSRKEKPSGHFCKSLKKHGFCDFKWEVVQPCVDKEEMNSMECYYIKEFDCYKNGYNETRGGCGTCGRKQSEATKGRISRAKIGIPLSEEAKANMSKAHLGVKKSKEHVANVAHAKSQFWEVVHPDNKIEIIRNLSLFCREKNISDRGMWLVANDYRTHHKGYKCKKLYDTK